MKANMYSHLPGGEISDECHTLEYLEVICILDVKNSCSHIA